ncbi:hypothetical protein STEG23_032258, partial [Scotinomys teguina]
KYHLTRTGDMENCHLLLKHCVCLCTAILPDRGQWNKPLNCTLLFNSLVTL